MQEAAGIQQVNQAVASLSPAGRDSAAATKQIQDTSVNLAEIGAQLKRFIGGKQSS